MYMKQLLIFTLFVLIKTNTFSQNTTIVSGIPAYKSVPNISILTGTNAFFNPINTPTFSRLQFIYSVSELNGFNVPFVTATVIDTVWLAYKDIGLPNIPGTQLTNFAISIGYSSTMPSAMSTNITANYIPGTLVNCFFAPNFNFVTPNTTTWVGIRLNTPFVWNGTQNLFFSFQYGTSTNSVNALIVESNPASLQFNSIYTNINGTASSLANSRPIIGLSGKCPKPNKSIVNSATITCANNNSVSLTSSSTTPTASPVWIGPGVVSGGNTFNPVVNATGQYTMILTNSINNCKDTGKVTVTSNLTLPNVSILPADKLGCNTKSVDLIGTSITGGALATWSGQGVIGANTNFIASVNQLGSYTLTVTNPINACKNSQTVTVNPKTGVNNFSAITKNSTCNAPNGNILIQSISGGNGPYSISNGLTSITGINSLPKTFDNLLARPYRLIVKDNDGCEYTNTATVEATSYPTAISTNTSEASCNGNADGTITITNVIGGIAPYSFRLNNQSIQVPFLPYSITKLLPNSYKLVVSDRNDCKISSDVSTIGEYDLPKAYINALPMITTIKESEIKFNGSASKTIVKWEWAFNDQPKGFSNQQNPSHKFNTTGKHEVKLIITDQLGCIDTATSEVLIEHVFKFFAANSFTPNGDIYNEKWQPKGIGIDKDNYNLKVFNRWGQMIFESNDFDLGWDGKVNGIKLPDGEFTWQVRLKDLNGVSHRLQGLLILGQ